jgi:hypothetical protein
MMRRQRASNSNCAERSPHPAEPTQGPEKAALRQGAGVFDDIISDELNTSVSPTAKDDLAESGHLI